MLCAFVLAASQNVGAGTVNLVLTETGATYPITASVERGLVYASAQDVARALGFDSRWDSQPQQLIVSGGSRPATFTAWNPVVLIGDGAFNLPRMTVIRGSELLAPAEALSAVFDSIAADIVSWDGEARIFRVYASPTDLRQSLAPASVVSADSRDQWRISTIVVDAGHGGRDPGTICVSGGQEKDIALAVSQLLAQQLRRELGVTVVTTRTADEFVNLRERGRIAVRENAKLFISIHCNAINKPSISGVQTYFLSDAQTDEARAVARAENAALTYEDSTETADADGGSQEVSEILSGMVSDRYLKESQELAALVQHELVRGLGARDMGVHQAGFYVMKGTLAEMPSILVEIGYLTNAAEARRLQQASYQTQIAAAVTRAVRQFKMRYERELEH
jgi:N-acetylmuramoyl-L-alanine amidase